MSQDPLEYENIHDGDEWSLYSLFHFLKNNLIQILMLVAAIIIILVVDYIAHINASVYSLPSAIPGLPGISGNNNNNNIKPMPQTHVPTKISFRKHKKSHRRR
jgi:hypothetical protein